MEKASGAATLDEYIALMVRFIKTPADAVNENELHDYCFQRWHGRKTKGGYSERTVQTHAEDFDRQVSKALPDADRNRKISPRTA